MNKYLTFMLNEQKYGIDISQIRELIKFKEINSIPNSKKEVIGIFYIRNRPVTLFSLADLLKVSNNEETIKIKENIIIMDFNDRYFSLNVEKFLGIIEINEDEIKHTHLMTEKVKGVFNKDDNLFIILNIENLMINFIS